MRKAKDRLVKTKFVKMGDKNAKISNLQIHLLHTVNSFDMTDSSSDKGYEGRKSKDTANQQ
jgi:hypothetical protein